MPLLSLFFRTIVGLLTLFFVTCVVVYSLPQPLVGINIILLVSVIYFVYQKDTRIFWFSGLFHFFLELYSINFFGLLLTSSSIALLVFFWLYKQVLTNTSWYAISILLFLVVGVYKFFYGLLFYLQKIFFSYKQSFLFYEYVWLGIQEMFCTAVVGGLVYIILEYVLLPKKKQKKIFRL